MSNHTSENNNTQENNTKNYVDTIFKPQTSFPIKDDPKRLFSKEETQKLYEEQYSARMNASQFALIDGPPYANGHIHTGHLVNKIQKDIVNQQQCLLGKRSVFIPGWDCHGLPIEKKVEEELKAEAKDKDFNIKKVDPMIIRTRCRAFAEKWIEVQSHEFAQLGVFANWDNYFTTMQGQLNILRNFHEIVKNGYVYRGVKPIMWSVAEQTSMATAEVEYKDNHVSTSIDVVFEVIQDNGTHNGRESLLGANIVIWTTTPWTIPANRAICYNDDIEYFLIEFESGANAGKRYVISEKLLPNLIKRMTNSNQTDSKVEITYKILDRFKGKALEGVVCSHPFRGKLDNTSDNKSLYNYEFDVPLIEGDHVTEEDGTGFVHTAPSHGEVDFLVGKAHNLEMPNLVSDNGYFINTPIFTGMSLKDGQKAILEELATDGRLLSQNTITHSYPYSWRSHTPLIYRITPQWYMSIDPIRGKISKLVDELNWYPTESKNRFTSMYNERPDWCISRQRAWGVPLALFTDSNEKPVFDEVVLNRTFEYLKENGVDSWWQASSEEILGSEYAEKYKNLTKSMDVLDVWFDAGSMQFCLQHSDNTVQQEVHYPIDLYLEGSDQHRGFFQACLTANAYNPADSNFSEEDVCVKGILTHGFILDEKGRKMSKSLGNVVSPEEVFKSYDLDTVRLWVSMTDVTDDIKYSKKQMEHTVVVVKRLRNTLRYLLGCLHDFSSDEALNIDQWLPLERSIYSKLYQLNEKFIESAGRYQSREFYHELYQFCDEDLSSIYFDMSKDVMYCDNSDSLARRSIRSCFALIREMMCKWLSPVMKFAAADAWKTFNDDSVFTQTLQSLDSKYFDEKSIELWNSCKAVRSVVNASIEILREKNELKQNSQASVSITVPAQDFEIIAKSFSDADELLRMFTLVAELKVEQGDEYSSIAEVFDGVKCSRCRRLFKRLATDDLCDRCEKAVNI